MGQGFSLATPTAGSTGIDIPQLQDVQYERSIGNARFMKSIRGRHENGVVLVKVLVKPYTEVKLDRYKKKIIGQLLSPPPYAISANHGTSANVVAKSNERLSPMSPTP